ncbi:pyridoxamine kinase [Clostridium estertheticum]|uniref:Pyridoxamine kinase n=1 Tax=Clostridium estertheticum TaxID=238834 RepID=A0AA47EEZ2_9CLOT|nr:pyridoxamine kinase [Clostridium estertheticum]MBU3156521.1 pyridoxamine kinase [Clostridium estertheticum]WAG58978.1 pyridoxamine kinase [Clostridium estertheticum]
MSLNKQKKIAIVNDFTGFGRCSIAVALPIISAMKIQCCPLPTAILSAHTGFSNFFFDDYTPHMRDYMNNWKELNLQFDGICTGFLGSKEQIDVVVEFLCNFKTKDTIVMVDPVMGDYGKLYSTYTQEMCDEMKKLIKYADVMTPNLTEACRLLDIPYPEKTLNPAQLENIAKELCTKGPDKIVITGLQHNGNIRNFIYEIGKPYTIIEVKKIGEDRSGTGDVFSSIVVANIVKGVDIVTAVKKATDFISKAIDYTAKIGTPVHDGICFEEYLTDLQ